MQDAASDVQQEEANHFRVDEIDTAKAGDMAEDDDAGSDDVSVMSMCDSGNSA